MSVGSSFTGRVQCPTCQSRDGWRHKSLVSDWCIFGDAFMLIKQLLKRPHLCLDLRCSCALCNMELNNASEMLTLMALVFMTSFALMFVTLQICRTTMNRHPRVQPYNRPPVYTRERIERRNSINHSVRCAHQRRPAEEHDERPCTTVRVIQFVTHADLLPSVKMIIMLLPCG